MNDEPDDNDLSQDYEAFGDGSDSNSNPDLLEENKDELVSGCNPRQGNGYVKMPPLKKLTSYQIRKVLKLLINLP